MGVASMRLRLRISVLWACTCRRRGTLCHGSSHGGCTCWSSGIRTTPPAASGCSSRCRGRTPSPWAEPSPHISSSGTRSALSTKSTWRCITTRRCARRSHSCTRLQISRPTAPPPPAPPPRRRRRQLHRRRRRRRRLRHRRSAGIAQSASARSSPGMRPCGAAAKAVSTTTSTPSACSNGSHSAAPAMGPRARSAEGAYSSTRSASTPS
mmetsp:Transcript_133238/g.426246  ORF Transcript_133238/g.426246 Transcript_133238/m.426246 type:complete len:209 (+) Transcript_133238:308-934(+)